MHLSRLSDLMDHAGGSTYRVEGSHQRAGKTAAGFQRLTHGKASATRGLAHARRSCASLRCTWRCNAPRLSVWKPWNKAINGYNPEIPKARIWELASGTQRALAARSWRPWYF